DVYSVNAATQRAAQSLAGTGSLLQAYGAIASVPGVQVPSGQQGWYQSVYVRGGDIDQVAYEFDGLPVTRQSDNAPIATLTSLGNQEVQVYTGGTPATSNSSGLAGYINQVIKVGTHPGYAEITAGLGGPAFYHSLVAEAGGASPNRSFSYYVGLAGTNQDYRYGTQWNDAGNPLYFYPVSIPTSNSTYNILDGSGGSAPDYGAQFGPGNLYAQATNFDRENVVNLHFGVPHKFSMQRDDVQLLYVTGGIDTKFYSSANESGSGVLPWLDSVFYTGPLFAAPDASKLVVGPFPSSPLHAPGSTIDPNERDASRNGYSIAKVQYQHNINDRSYWRLLGFGEYSDWFINGPNSAQLIFGAQLADYEVIAHIYGGGFTYANQISSKHLLTASANYMTQKLQTYNATFSSTDPNTTSLPPTGLGTVLSNYVDNAGNCYNYTTGDPWSCFDAGSQGGLISSSINLTPGTAPGGTAAALAGAHWVVTEDGRSAQVDNVRPYFTSFALTDLYQPNDKLTMNIGARFDHFAYATDDLTQGYPARQFWFDAYNREHCGALGSAPVWTWNGSSFDPCPAGLQPMTDPGNGLYNVGSDFIVHNVFQPRAAFTYSLNPDTVIRGSYGKYARAEATSYYQYNTYQQNLASFIAQFYSYGYHSPTHDIHPDTSDNYDLSLEKHLKGTQFSFKLSPFYRRTRDQLQFQAIDALGGTLAGLNVGTQVSKGIEFSMQDGDFSRNGLAFSFAYTHTDSKIRFAKINGISVIDTLNAEIARYNSYTHAGGGTPCFAFDATTGVYSSPDATCAAGSIRNPYFANTPQPLMDTGASYTPYDVIPTPFNAANGYEVPNIYSLIANYRYGKIAVTPAVRFNDGSFYGSPLVWPGYVPDSCASDPALTPDTPGISCGAGGALFLPNPYTGKFDSFGSLRQPSELTLNLQATYDFSPRVSVQLMADNIIHRCYQRGYAWDNKNTCVYSNLPSNILPPAGNFLTNPPIQLAYPYGTFFNITEVGATSAVEPFNAFVNLTIKF
ncbi:MAG: TonB-dependent receptor, partial [Candidatus Eremiobacteraeota bacterium]|nr:TonB-dependent receptor [Candidatus Eremiobacteraeota bacterium]